MRMGPTDIKKIARNKGPSGFPEVFNKILGTFYAYYCN